MMSDMEEEMDVDDPDPIDDLDLIHAGIEREGDRGNASGNDDNDDENRQENGEYNGAEEAATGDADGEKKEVKKKRVILNPQPKLNYHTLTGKRGLCAMKEVFADIQLKGKGHERADLNRIMSKLEYWTHRLFPRYSFDEVLTRIEKLGNKRPVQVYLKRMRLGMDDLLNPISNEFVEEEPASPPPEQSADDVFDSLFPTEPVVPATTPKPTVEITAEQRERMERNRQLALERRLARIEAQKEEERRKASETAAGSPGTSGGEPSTSTSIPEPSASTSMPENSSEPELMDENPPDSGIRQDNLFECSQEVSSISKPSSQIPEVNTGSLNDSFDGSSERSSAEQLKQCDDISKPSGHTPEDSTVNLNDSFDGSSEKSASEQPKQCDNISKPLGHTPEDSTVNLNDSLEGSSERLTSEQPKHCDSSESLPNETECSVTEDSAKTASLSRFDEVPMSEPIADDMDTIPEETASKISINASELVEENISQGSEDS